MSCVFSTADTRHSDNDAPTGRTSPFRGADAVLYRARSASKNYVMTAEPGDDPE